MSVDEIRKNGMMAHLLEALERDENIGHYGRLVFAIVARHFVEEGELVSLLARDPECSEEEARALVLQCRAHDYSPPRRERILEWQAHQRFPIIPNASDPDEGNVYRDLEFPKDVYHHITEYYEHKAEAEESGSPKIKKSA